jgi:NAD(P) transhydrogenase subunit alpha
MKHLLPTRCALVAGLLAFGAASTLLGADVVLPAAASAASAGAAPPAAMPHAGAETMDYVATLFVFMLATFVGLDVIRRVSRLLHTPLMSLTNAISAIAVVGSILIAGQQHGDRLINVLGLIAIVASVTNIVSGFLITDRMLKMFKKREAKKP